MTCRPHAARGQRIFYFHSLFIHSFIAVFYYIYITTFLQINLLGEG